MKFGQDKKSDVNLNAKYEAFFIIFEGLLLTRNCLRLGNVPFHVNSKTVGQLYELNLFQGSFKQVETESKYSMVVRKTFL